MLSAYQAQIRAYALYSPRSDFRNVLHKERQRQTRGITKKQRKKESEGDRIKLKSEKGRDCVMAKNRHQALKRERKEERKKKN